MNNRSASPAGMATLPGSEIIQAAILVLEVLKIGRVKFNDNFTVTVDGIEMSEAAIQPNILTPQPSNIFKFNGKTWDLQFEGRVASMSDGIGLHYIKHLIQIKGEEIHVTGLVTGAYGEPEEIMEKAALLEDDVAIEFSDEENSDAPNGQVVTTEFRDEILSDEDRGFVLELLEKELKHLAQLEKKGLPCDILLKKEEIKAIEKYLEDHRFRGQNVCFEDRGGRDRGSVKNAITRTIAKIEEIHPALAKHLRVSIKTGYYCSYAPATDAVWTA